MIRRAIKDDIPRIMELLSEVLEIHAKIRPDIFVPGTTKYPAEQLEEIISNEKTPVWVDVEEGEVAGYAFCVLKDAQRSENVVPHKLLYIDDLCVAEKFRGRGIGRALFDHAVAEAKKHGCFEVTLVVWEGNDSARAFYDRMGMKPKETVMEFITED